MKMQKIVSGLLMLALCGACSHVDESERFIYVKPAVMKRAVLIEEFTGQRCINCPTAAVEIEKLQEQYGEDHVISVAVHSGPLAVFPTDGVVGLRTALGDEYYDHFGVEMEPSALINRRGGVMRQDKWGSCVYAELQMEAPVQLSLTCSQESDSKVEVRVEAVVTESIKGKLQLWLTEDSITALQMMPDGTIDSQYSHQHVLRTALNGTWGDDVEWKPGEMYSLAYTFSMDSHWVPRHLSVIAFVDTEEGVVQVCRKKIFNH